MDRTIRFGRLLSIGAFMSIALIGVRFALSFITEPETTWNEILTAVFFAWCIIFAAYPDPPKEPQP